MKSSYPRVPALKTTIMTTRSKKASAPSIDLEDFREEMKTLIKEEIMNAFAIHVKEALQHELSSIVAPLKEQLEFLKSENTKLRDTSSKLEKELIRLSAKCNANEQYSRKYNLRIGGIKEEPDEDCYGVVFKFVESQLGVTINDAEIDRVHRVGKPGGLNPRQLIVKFKGFRAKQEILKNRRKLKGKTGIFINEDLTATNLELLRYARQAENISSAWSNDGKIFVKISDESIHVVCCCEDVLNLKPIED